MILIQLLTLKEIKKENKTREEFYQDIIAELGRR